MAAKKRAQSGPPEGFTVLEDAAPDGSLELEVGEDVTGVLVGGAVLSKKNPERGMKYRKLKTADGVWHVGGVKLNQLGLMGLEPGTVVWIKREKDVQVQGMPQPMKDYTVAVSKNGQVDGDDLPF